MEKKGSQDGIAAKDIKMLDEDSIQTLTTFFNDYSKPNAPEGYWTTIQTWLIPKKSGDLQAKDLRPIAALSHIYKLFMKAITNRIKNHEPKRQWLSGSSGGSGPEEMGYIVAEGYRKKKEWENKMWCIKLDTIRCLRFCHDRLAIQGTCPQQSPQIHNPAHRS